MRRKITVPRNCSWRRAIIDYGIDYPTLYDHKFFPQLDGVHYQLSQKTYRQQRMSSSVDRRGICGGSSMSVFIPSSDKLDRAKRC